MKTMIGAILAALLSASAGGYVLWSFKTTPGLFCGVGLIALSLAIAFPTQTKGALVILYPYLPDALKGGARKTDPPADPPSSEPPHAPQ